MPAANDRQCRSFAGDICEGVEPTLAAGYGDVLDPGRTYGGNCRAHAGESAERREGQGSALGGDPRAEPWSSLRSLNCPPRTIRRACKGASAHAMGPIRDLAAQGSDMDHGI